MRFDRPFVLAALGLLALAGCRTAGVDNLAQRQAIPPKASSVDAGVIIAEHNRNAERIQSIEAHTAISASMDRGRSYAVDGGLAMERPRNFKLDLRSSMAGEVGDIGSNDDKFWFWVRDNKDKAVYYCHYDEAGTTPATLQPEWIVEALGLRAITPEEAAEATSARGQDPDTIVITLKPTRIGGEKITRKVIASEKSRRIREFRLYSDQNALLARAVIEQYQNITPLDAKPGADPIFLPSKLKLEWVREKLTMDVTFPTATKVNVKFPERQREALFVEEPRSGYARRNLAEYARLPARGPTSIRETRPAPPTGNVQLGAPTPIGVDSAAKSSNDPLSLFGESFTPPGSSDGLLGPPIPKAPELQYAQPDTSGWRGAVSANFER